MTVNIQKKSLEEIKKILEQKLESKSKKGNLRKHFGKLKRNLDGLEYQKQVRENEV